MRCCRGHCGRRSHRRTWSGRTAVELLTEPVAWPAGGRVRRAGVSAFGVSGTNAHLVLEEAPDEPAAPVHEVPARLLPFMVSGSSEAALSDQATRLRDFVARQPELDAAEVARSLAFGRAQLSHRAVAVVGGLGELADCLGGFERGEFVEGLRPRLGAPRPAGRVCASPVREGSGRDGGRPDGSFAGVCRAHT